MKKLKKYLRSHPEVQSAVHTFITTFVATLTPLLGSVSWEKAMLAGAFVTALRAGVKALGVFFAEDKLTDYKNNQ